MAEFVHWVQRGPEGPAWHAILETDEGRIVGHTSVFPLRAAYDSEFLPAKSEYSFLHEDFRSFKVRGFETVSRPAFIILIDQLIQHCYARGWGPIFALFQCMPALSTFEPSNSKATLCLVAEEGGFNLTDESG